MIERDYQKLTRRGLIRFLVAAATAARSVWGKAAVPNGAGISLRPRSMFFSTRSPQVQILCSIEGISARGEIRAVRVNDELIPGSHWQFDHADLVIYVEERVVNFNLSRFPNVEALLGD
jgi:hypothetical protein